MGPDGKEDIEIGLRLIAEAEEIGLEVSEIHLAGYDEVYIYTAEPALELRLNRGNLEGSIENLAIVLQNRKENLDSIDYIDLNIAGKVFVHERG